MRLLLDTHALLWWWADDAQLRPNARAAIADETSEALVSAATAWEIATKQRLGKLAGVPPGSKVYADLLADDNFLTLPINASHAWLADPLAAAHRDPFHRMLAAQADMEALLLVTRDPAFAAFGTRTL